MLKRPCSFSAPCFSAHHISVQLCEFTSNLNLELSAADRSWSHCSTASSSPPSSTSSPFPNNSLFDLRARCAASIACPTTMFLSFFWFIFCHFSELHQSRHRRTEEDLSLLLGAVKGLMLNWDSTRDPSCRIF